MCTWSRYVVVAGLTGLAVATIVGSDLAGWLVAAVVVGVMAAADRLRGRARTCAIAPVDAGDAHQAVVVARRRNSTQAN